MLILGIETSCDETSAAVVEDGRLVRSNVVSSQIEIHALFGGVVPEIASRQHVRVIVGVVEKALRDAGVELRDVDTIAVTYGPGLAGSLLVGVNFAQGLAQGASLPLYMVNHLEGHIHSVWLSRDCPLPSPPELPLLTLIVSGGHTQLVLMREHGQYEPIGGTLDDAAGEAFDKVARLLGLAYPGGPAIQRAAESGDSPVHLPRAWLPDSFDFSFSGLKTASLHAVYREVTGRDPHEIRGKALPQIDVAEGLTDLQVSNIAAGFQESVVDVLTTKTARAADFMEARSVAVVGGVAANSRLSERMRQVVKQPLFVAAPEFSTDNAAMIAAAAHFVPRLEDETDVRPSLSLTEA